jgi:flagella basal body P-ring formation protein FlgA
MSAARCGSRPRAALARAGAGDYVRVMNLSSRVTISGRVTASGLIEVSR